MKFMTEDGKILEGVPLTDRQSILRDRFEEYLHDHVCGNSYHVTYASRPCRETANTLIPKLDDSSAGALLTAMFEPDPEPEPIADPPAPELVLVVAAEKDEIPF